MAEAPREPIPPLALLLAFGPAWLILLAGAGAWLLPVAGQRQAMAGGWLWSAAILLSLAGVTRGTGFMAPGGSRAVQVVQSLWLFAAGFGALLLPLALAFPLLAAGYLSVALFDRWAAARALAPGWFARLRSPQMAVALVGLVLLEMRLLAG